jgi:hypothetical protein
MYTIYLYKRKNLEISPNNGHYAYLQVENNNLHKTLSSLNAASKALQEENKQLKASLLSSRPIEYESTKPLADR